MKFPLCHFYVNNLSKDGNKTDQPGLWSCFPHLRRQLLRQFSAEGDVKNCFFSFSVPFLGFDMIWSLEPFDKHIVHEYGKLQSTLRSFRREENCWCHLKDDQTSVWDVFSAADPRDFEHLRSFQSIWLSESLGWLLNTWKPWILPSNMGVSYDISHWPILRSVNPNGFHKSGGKLRQANGHHHSRYLGMVWFRRGGFHVFHSKHGMIHPTLLFS